MAPRPGSYHPFSTTYETVEAPGRDARRNFYLDELLKLQRGVFRVEGHTEGVVCRAGMTFEELADSVERYPFGRRFGGTRRAAMLRRLYTGYVQPLAALAAELAIAEPFLVLVGDNRQAASVPAFAKSRPADIASLTVLQPLHRKRHLAPLGDVDRSDVPYEAKEKRLVWRGATTGRFTSPPGALDYSSRFYVQAFRARNTNPAIDVAYSRVVQLGEALADCGLDAVERSVGAPLTMAEHLRARFLLALEGNDVASSAKWMLYSNSVVLMPRPRYTTWACEHWLRPFVHYVPVRPDLSDLEDMFQWCLAHDDECRAIARNGRAFMASFRDEALDRELMSANMTEYARRVRLRPAGADMPADLL